MGWMTNRLPTMWVWLDIEMLACRVSPWRGSKMDKRRAPESGMPRRHPTCDFTALSFGPLVLIASGGVQVTGTACAWREAGGG